MRSLAVLLFWLASTCFAVLHYQPWEDEGRAWMDAKDCGFFDLTFHILRYEGHPALWYWILWPLTRLHLPFAALNWLAVGFAACAVCLLLRRAPFPFYVRALLPFTFTLAYEYAVVARSYCLFPLLGFWVADEYRSPLRRPVRMAVALALLANLSIHGTLVAAGFAVAYGWRFVQERRTTQPSPGRPYLAGAAIFAFSVIFVAVTIWPPADLRAPLGPKMNQLLHRLVAEHPNPPSPRHLLQQAAYTLQQPAPPDHTPGYSLSQRLRYTFIYPLSPLAPLALLFGALAVIFLVRRRQPLLLLPPALLAAFLVTVYVKLWHTGLIWVTLLMVLWAAWNEHQPANARSLQTLLAASLALLSLLQISWTFKAIRYETTHLTYPAAATAAYLRTLPPGVRVDGYDHSFTLLPYVGHAFFHRQATALDSPESAIADHPNAIVLRENSIPASGLAELQAAGYHQTRSFCGTQYFPRQPLAPTCLLVLEK